MKLVDYIITFIYSYLMSNKIQGNEAQETQQVMVTIKAVHNMNQRKADFTGLKFHGSQHSLYRPREQTI